MLAGADVFLRQPRRVDDRQTAKVTSSSGYDLRKQQQWRLRTVQRRRRVYGYRLLRVDLCQTRNMITRDSLYSTNGNSSETKIQIEINKEEMISVQYIVVIYIQYACILIKISLCNVQITVKISKEKRRINFTVH